MRILLSTYSCGPNQGSEPGIGWNWALRASRLGHEVILVLRAVDLPPVEAALAGLPERQRIKLIAYDPPWWPTREKHGDRFIRFHNLLWQIGVYFFLRKQIRVLDPDLVHHLTWGVFRQPSFLGWLGVPFVFGPVGGGEMIPWRLRHNFTLPAHLFEILRDTLNLLVRFDPLMTLTFWRARFIAVRNEETRAWIPRPFRNRVIQYTELGVDRSVFVPSPPLLPRPGLRILFVGRLLHWKGVYYVIEAYRAALERMAYIDLTIVGAGPELARLQRMAARLGIGHRINWLGRVDYAEMAALYREHDIFLFPSLHESGGTVVVEALSHGLPVVTVDFGGPKEIVDNRCGRVVRTAGLDARALIAALADALIELADPELRDRLSKAAYQRMRDFFTWEYRIAQFYQLVAKTLDLRGRPTLTPLSPVPVAPALSLDCRE